MAYIDRDKLLQKMKNWHTKERLIDCVKDMSTADVQEVKHGKWIQNQYHKNIYRCSECGRRIQDENNNPLEHFPYCPCGAKMDLEE